MAVAPPEALDQTNHIGGGVGSRAEDNLVKPIYIVHAITHQTWAIHGTPVDRTGGG